MSDETIVETDLTGMDNSDESTPHVERTETETKVTDGEKHLVGAAAGKPTAPKNLAPSIPTPGAKQAAAQEGKPNVIPGEYVPNLKFKVLDQEKEFDEWLKPIVKNKEMEDKVRDLLTKAHGITKIKSERDSLRSEYDNFKTSMTKEYGPVVQNYNHLSQKAGQARQSGDWGEFFHAAQIPVEGVIRWAANTVAQLEKNPNYLDQAQSSWNTNSNLTNLKSENETLRQQMDRSVMERQQVELDYTLRGPDIQTFAESFDTRVGKPGAFRSEVIRRGALIEMTEKRVASAQEIVGDLMKFYGGVPQAPSQSDAMQGQPLNEGTQTVVTGSEGKPVLPNVKGKSNSPARTIIRSTDDLRKLSAQRAAG